MLNTRLQNVASNKGFNPVPNDENVLPHQKLRSITHKWVNRTIPFFTFGSFITSRQRSFPSVTQETLIQS